MDVSLEQPLREVENAGAQRLPPAGPAAPEIDLDRLVWDPEYRRLMRQFLKNGS